jgi:hypothetical protein
MADAVGAEHAFFSTCDLPGERVTADVLDYLRTGLRVGMVLPIPPTPPRKPCGSPHDNDFRSGVKDAVAVDVGLQMDGAAGQLRSSRCGEDLIGDAADVLWGLAAPR